MERGGVVYSFLFYDCNDCVCVFTLIGYDLMILIFFDDFFDENEEEVGFSSNIIKRALNRRE